MEVRNEIVLIFIRELATALSQITGKVIEIPPVPGNLNGEDDHQPEKLDTLPGDFHELPVC